VTMWLRADDFCRLHASSSRRDLFSDSLRGCFVALRRGEFCWQAGGSFGSYCSNLNSVCCLWMAISFLQQLVVNCFNSLMSRSLFSLSVKERLSVT
jgi:hypothetical protein